MFDNDGDSLPVLFIKHPFVWSGAGLLIRYAGDDSRSASLWRSLGVLSLAIGAAHTLSKRAAVPSKRLA
jgi:hypothetical protein